MQHLEPGAAERRARRHGRRTLLLVVAIFLAPLLLATGLYLAGWKPHGRQLGYGELLAEPRPIAGTELVAADGTPLHFGQLRGHWALVYFDRLPCDERCQASLYNVQQVRLAQGRDARRVERLFIALAPAAPAERQALAQRYPGLRVLQAEPPALAALAREFVTAGGSAWDGLARVYVVDPNGNLVLSYPPGADPSGMRKDLARLLRLSRIG